MSALRRVYLLHAAHKLSEWCALRPYDNGVYASSLALVELRGHVGVVHTKFFVAGGLQALQISEFLHILQATLAITRRFGEIADVLHGGILLHVGHQARDLIAVDHRYTEHVIVGAGADRSCDGRSGTDGADDGNLLLVRNMFPRERVARVRGPEHRHDLLVVDQVRHILNRLRRLGEIVTDNEGQLSTEHATRSVDVINRGLQTKKGRLAAQRLRRGG